jgi:myo-inositol-1(or 4)-monophosphatase
VTFDLDRVLRCAEEAVRAAAAVLAPRLGQPGTVRQKPAGPVTESDLLAETALVSVIRAHFPDHAILSEEMGAVGVGPARWVADPLDGTVNFARGVPWYDVSLAFEVGGRVEVGVVHAPGLGQLFSAVRGQGAWLDGRRIRVSGRAELAGGLVDVGLSREDWSDPARQARVGRLAAAGAEVRSLNACGLDLAFVAAGRLEAYWDEHVEIWDTAAGALLVAEAGGRVSEHPRPGGRAGVTAILASNGFVHGSLGELLGFGPGGTA